MDRNPTSAAGPEYYFLGFLLALALMGSLQTGIFDPLPLVHRSVNLALTPFRTALGLLGDGPAFIPQPGSSGWFFWG